MPGVPWVLASCGRSAGQQARACAFPYPPVAVNTSSRWQRRPGCTLSQNAGRVTIAARAATKPSPHDPALAAGQRLTGRYPALRWLRCSLLATQIPARRPG
jgi:hypothetical protein